MKTLLTSLLCGLAGAIATHVAYVRSNLFILGDSVRRGRHTLYDPLGFDAMGVIWGVVVGAVCAAWLFTTSPLKATLAGLAITVLGIGVVGGVTTYQRYRALPREPRLAGPPQVLELEVRLPADLDAKGPLPTRGALNPASKQGSVVDLLKQQLGASEGRVVLPGRVPLLYAESPRLIVIELADGTTANFMLPLAEQPTDADRAWTDWMSQVNADRGQLPAKVFQLRYRVAPASGR